MESLALCGRSILVIEEEAFTALEAVTDLSDAGAKVYSAHRLRDALHMAEHPALSAVVIAQRLGADHTAPVCRRLADLGIPFVFHTRYDVTEAKQNWPDAPVVTKPASPRELVRAVVGLLT